VVVGKTATLELSPRQVEMLGQARQMGTLSLALRSIVDFDAKESAPDDSRRGINVVRFGVTTTQTPK
jgi:pilus assembly protein CpaB